MEEISRDTILEILENHSRIGLNFTGSDINWCADSRCMGQIEAHTEEAVRAHQADALWALFTQYAKEERRVEVHPEGDSLPVPQHRFVTPWAIDHNTSWDDMGTYVETPVTA